jgi:hypothetical protein
MDELDSEDKRILSIIERKPYGAYPLNSLIPFTLDSLTRRMEMNKEYQRKVNRLVEFGFIKAKSLGEKMLYCSPKAKI